MADDNPKKLPIIPKIPLNIKIKLPMVLTRTSILGKGTNSRAVPICSYPSLNVKNISPKAKMPPTRVKNKPSSKWKTNEGIWSSQ